jgi:hypothetical protein
MSQINWISDSGEEHEEVVSVVDLTSRITSLTTAILLLFQFVFRYYLISYLNEKMKRYIEGTTMLRERPGLQNITYSARFDKWGE